MSESFLGGKVELHCGDCLDVLASLPDNSVDSCVTDPPYHLVSIYKRFANEARNEKTVGNGAYGRHATGFMGKQWDGGDIAFRPELWAEVLRVLKPGAHLLAFGGTRTYHRMACAIEDAGFEIRDCIQWLYGSGFPKSHDVSKGIDRAAGAEREVVGKRQFANGTFARDGAVMGAHNGIYGAAPGAPVVTAPATDAARQWEGWGTALKPANEPICLARKPLSESTVAANVLKWGTGAINVDGCRVGAETEIHASKPRAERNGFIKGFVDGTETEIKQHGRWPANVIHDGSEEVVAGFPESDGQQGALRGTEPSGTFSQVSSGLLTRNAFEPRGDSGSAARFFYTAKADSDDRLGSKHPTVKPLDLMQYLVRLVTPKGGVVLDPFAGTGATGEAAWREGMHAVLIEREAEYGADIRRRMELALSGPDERLWQSAKARQGDKPPDYGPLFDRQKWDEMWARPFDQPELL